MLRGVWERVGREVGEGKEWQMKGSRKGVRGGGLEEVGVGRGEKGGEGVRRARGRDEIGWSVGRKGN